MCIKDKDSTAIFDDYVEQSEQDIYDTTHWTQICDRCAKIHHLPDSCLELGAGHGICGALGCDKESDHYYDFTAERIITRSEIEAWEDENRGSESK